MQQNGHSTRLTLDPIVLFREQIPSSSGVRTAFTQIVVRMNEHRLGVSKLCAALLPVVKYAREAPQTALGNLPRKDSHL
jgi:hypothetical protein